MASDPGEDTAVVSQGVRVAVVQAAPVLFDAHQSLQKLADLTADAARGGAELVVFPEAFIAGYPRGHDFGVSVGVRTPEGRDEVRRLFEDSVCVGALARMRTRTSGVIAGCASNLFIWPNCCTA